MLVGRDSVELLVASLELVSEWAIAQRYIAAVQVVEQLGVQQENAEVAEYESLHPLCHRPHPSLPRCHSDPYFRIEQQLDPWRDYPASRLLLAAP